MSRCLLATIAVTVLAAGGSGCGGSGGSGGGGGGVPGPQITAVAPSTVMQRGPIPVTDFAFYLFGKNFTQAAQVFVDGQPSSSTSLLNSKTLKTEFVFSLSSVIGTH